MKRSLGIVVLGCLCILLVLAGCSDSREIEGLEAEIGALQSDNAELRNELASLKAEFDEIKELGGIPGPKGDTGSQGPRGPAGAPGNGRIDDMQGEIHGMQLDIRAMKLFDIPMLKDEVYGTSGSHRDSRIDDMADQISYSRGGDSVSVWEFRSLQSRVDTLEDEAYGTWPRLTLPHN